MSAEKDLSFENIEEIKTFMLSINSKTDKLIQSQASLSDLLTTIFPDFPLMSDPVEGVEGDYRIEAVTDEALSFENMPEYMHSIASKMAKVKKLQAALQFAFQALIPYKFPRDHRPIFPVPSVVHLPPAGGFRSYPWSAPYGDVLVRGFSGGAAASEWVNGTLLRLRSFDSLLDEMIEAEAFLTAYLNDLVKMKIVYPTGVSGSDPRAVEELAETTRWQLKI